MSDAALHQVARQLLKQGLDVAGARAGVSFAARAGLRTGLSIPDRLRRLVPQLRIQRVPHRRNLAFLHGAQHRAVRLGDVMAVVEAAVAQIGGEFGKGTLQHAFAQVVQAEFLETGRIDDRAFAVDPVKACESGGVLAGVERGRNFTYGLPADGKARNF